MGRNKGTSIRHANPVPSLSNLVSPQEIPENPLEGAKNIRIKSLTTPLARNLPPIQKPTIKKPIKKINTVRKIGLEVLGIDSQPRNEGFNGEYGVFKRSNALNDSIAAVLNSRPQAAQDLEKEELKSNSTTTDFIEEEEEEENLFIEENLSAAERLRKELKEFDMEDEDEVHTSTSPIIEVVEKGKGKLEEVMLDDDSDSDSDVEIVVGWLTTSQETTLSSLTPLVTKAFPTISFQSSNSMKMDSIEVNQSTPSISQVLSSQTKLPFNSSSMDHQDELIKSSELGNVPSTDLMELDEIYPNNDQPFISPFNLNVSTSSPFVTSSSIPLISPSFIPPPYSAPIITLSTEPTFTQPEPELNFDIPTPSITPDLMSSTPLKSAANLTRGRTKKPKKVKKRTTKLFDYLSDESEDWDDPIPITSKRPRSGKALPGDTAPFPPAPGESPIVVDPEMILPNTRAHAGKLIPTSYQQALLEQAMKENVIVVLETGSGKTLISVLLLDWMHTTIEPERLRLGGKKRMQFVLTNSVPLVHQQANVLSSNSSLRVGKLFGALHVNLSSAEEWEWSFENFDCLVLTAQLLLDSLAHGFIDMSQIGLLVFDEAHHAKSNHPFASILRDFYHRTEKTLRPKILGLTASPLDSKEGLTDAKRLQDLFDARLVTAPIETRMALREMVSKPTILEVSYKPPPIYSNTKLNIAVHEKHLSSQSAIEKVLGPQGETESANEIVFSQCSRAANIALNELGPAACDLVYHLAYQKYCRNLLESTTSVDPEVEPFISNDENDLDPEFELIHPKKIVVGGGGEEDEDEVMNFGKENEIISGSKDNEEEIIKLPEWLMEVKRNKMEAPRFQNISPKLQALVKLLEACETVQNDFCGIVFVNRRLDAVLIAQLLRQFAKTSKSLNWLKVKCVTGHGNSQNTSLGPKMNWNDQAQVLTAFGAGHCNLLIATSVVEEGLDVQPCNFVARFDLPATHISYVQSRGRARRAGSHYLLFVQEGNHADRRKLAQIHKYDLDMDHLLDHVEKNYDGNADYGDEDDAGEENYLVEPKTGALLTPHFSVSLLYRYCQSLPTSDAYNLNKPIFDIQERTRDSFMCTVTLPPSSRVRTLTSNLCSSPKIAKREAAFMTCKLLRHYEALDEHLLPVRILTGPGVEVVKDENGKTFGSRKRQIGYEKKLSNPFHVQTPFTAQSILYGTYLAFDGPLGELNFRGEIYAPMILLTRNPLPKVPTLKLFIDGQPLLLNAIPLSETFSVSKVQRAVLLAYTLQVFSSTLNRTFEVSEDEILYFVAPLKNGRTDTTPLDFNILDWIAMTRAAVTKEEKLDLKHLDELDDDIIIDTGKNDCRYFFKALHRELNPSSKLPPGRQSDAGFFNVLDYYMSFNEPLFHKFHVNPTQPLLEVMRMPRVVSYLTATPRNNSSVSQKKHLERVSRFAIPQICSKHVLPSSHFRTQLMLPSILTELDQFLLVQELNAKLFGKKIDINLMRMALTTPSACLEEDYQRLELLGDAFLKYLSSVYCFVALDKTAHEGDLHHTRLLMIQNATLYKGGVQLNLPEYLVSKPFTSRLFIPPNFKLLKGQPPPHLALIGDKTIADVVESLIGAAYETGFAKNGIQGGFDLALEVCVILKIDIKGIKCWNDMSKAYGPLSNMNSIAEFPTHIEEKLFYRFTHAYLLTEALTHPSKLDAVASFQRLEWLGDSVLDFCVIGYAWNKWGGTLPPGHLTELKGAMVSNETLAALAVELDLDKYLAHDNALLSKNLDVYRKRLVLAKAKEVKEAEEECREARPYWLLLDAPKAISDIIESLFGAILVDSGFDPIAPQNTFDNLLVPFYDQWVSPTKLKIDAIRILLELAQGNGCSDVSHLSSTIDGKVNENGEITPKTVRTSVIAHDIVLATVQTVNPKTAKRAVSADALVYLEQNPGFFTRVCDCENRRAIAKEEAEEELERRRNEGLESDPPSSDEDEDNNNDDSEDEGYEGKGKGKKNDEDKMDEN